IDALSQRVRLTPKIVRKLADRHTGIGFVQAQEVSHLVVVDAEQRALGLLSREDVVRRGTDSPVSVSQADHRQMVVASPDTAVTSLAASFVR
ncbi:hypothetical protein Q6282_27545, partial [Klebsiella pneumoniae]|nr:hypothetical protein [Klebsiella pneumoniae]